MNDPHPLWQIRPEDFSNLIDVNVKGVFNVVRAFVPEMIKRRKGKIINFSSGWEICFIRSCALLYFQMGSRGNDKCLG